MTPTVPQPQSATPAQPQPRYKGIWEPVNYPEDVELTDVFFVSDQVGWVSGGASALKGGVLLQTKDGGDHWAVQLGDPQSSDRAFRDLRFFDPIHGWVVQPTGSDAKLLRTTDGESWQLVGTIQKHYVDYMFTSDMNGVVVDSHKIYQTQDGGRSWRPVLGCQAKVEIKGLMRNVGCQWQRVQFVTPAIGYAVGGELKLDAVFLAKTMDGGASWTMSVGAITGTPADAFFISESTGYIRVGAPDTGQLYKTDDGGRTWTGMAASPGKRLLFADPEVGWAVHYSKVSFTTDGGKRWNSRKYDFPASVNAFSLPRRDRGYVVGQHGMIYRYRIVPEDYTARGMIAAPLLSGIESPLYAQVQQFVTQINALGVTINAAPPATPGSSAPPASNQPAAGSGGGQAGGSPGNMSQQIGTAESTLNSVSGEVPQFVGKYKNLNLLMTGFQVATDLPTQVQGLLDSFQMLKKAGDAQSKTTALTDLRTKAQSLVTTTLTAYQKQ